MGGTHRIVESSDQIAKATSPQRGYLRRWLDWTLPHSFQQTRRPVFPAVESAAPPQWPSLKQFQVLARRIRWGIILLIVAVTFYMKAAFPLLPQEPIPGTLLLFFTGLLLAVALRLQRAGLTPGPVGKPYSAPESINPAATYRRQLTELRELILLRELSPSNTPLRAGAFAWTALLLTFAPSYPVVRWLSGYPLPEGVTWPAIASLFVMLYALFSWFVWICKASRLLADAIKDEIQRIDTEEGPQ